MALSDWLLSGAKAILNAAGVYAVRHRHLSFGVDYVLDVRALSRRLDDPIRVIFDVGANLGQTSAHLLKSFPGARVLAFEPHQKTCARLVDRFSADRRFRAFNLALSDETGPADFYEYENLRLSSLTPRARYAVRSGEAARMSRVEQTTIDRFCATFGIEHIDLLKIDTEGHDLAVLKGATALLQARRVGFVYVEFNDVGVIESADGGSLAEIDAWLRRFGFRFVASYTDDIILPDMFVVANALFALVPDQQADGQTVGGEIWSPADGG